MAADIAWVTDPSGTRIRAWENDVTKDVSISVYPPESGAPVAVADPGEEALIEFARGILGNFGEKR